MIHKSKAMYAGGRGSSIRAIAAELKVSRNTVRKYLSMEAEEIAEYRERQRRSRRLDVHRGYIVHLLERYPRLSAVKVLRKLMEAHGELTVSARTMRRYIEELRPSVVPRQKRYYEPVLDMVPGEQCQVDGGELRGVVIGGEERTVYLMVFVLSYSRLMYVAASDRAIDTEALIRMHHRAAADRARRQHLLAADRDRAGSTSILEGDIASQPSHRRPSVGGAVSTPP